MKVFIILLMLLLSGTCAGLDIYQAATTSSLWHAALSGFMIACGLYGAMLMAKHIWKSDA